MKTLFSSLQLRAGALVGAAIVVIVAGGFWWQLSGRVGSGTAGSGPSTATPSPAVTILPSPTTGSPVATQTPDRSSATVSIQTSHIYFLSQPSTSDAVFIDSTPWVRVAVDGTGQVAGFFKTFTYTPVFDNKPYTYDGSDLYEMAVQVGNSYTVPQNCMQLVYYTAAGENAANALSAAIDSYKQSTGGDAQELATRWSPAYPINTDTASAACNPAPGYTQSQPFAYTVLEPASVRLPFFRASDVTAYRIQQAKAHAPANYVFEHIAPCTSGGLVYISATAANLDCNVGGQYRWNWTSAVARTLASEIAGKDPATALGILAKYPGAAIYRSQGVSFQITGSTKLPTDPSRITFKVYDSVLIGTTGVQTTGTPLVLP